MEFLLTYFTAVIDKYLQQMYYRDNRANGLDYKFLNLRKNKILHITWHFEIFMQYS